MANPFEALQKLVTKSNVDLDSIIVKTLEKSSNFEQLKNISINSLLSAESNAIDKNGEVEKLFSEAEKNQYSLEPDRLSKYNDYEKIMEKLPTVAAAIETLVDNTITPDNNFSNVFRYETDGFVEITPELKKIIQSMKNIVKSKDLESIAEAAARDLAVFGCYFIEIKENKKQLLKYKVLQDSEEKIPQENKQDFYLEKRFTLLESKDEKGKSQINIVDFDKEYDNILQLSESMILLEDDKKDGDEPLLSNLDEIEVNVISPKNVLIVHAFNTILGFLVIIPQPGSITPNEQLARDVLTKLFQDSNIKNVKKLLDSNPQYEAYVAKLLSSYDQGISDIQTKFIPVDNMVYNYLGNKFPYGTSRLDAIRELAKYLIIGNNATMLYRFTRAPDIRIFKVDIGLDHDSAKYIQQIKRELTQRKYAIDMTQDVDTLTKQLTQFEDLWVPMRQGQQFFEIEIQPSGDLQSKIEDLKFMNDQIISGLDTPPNYLGLERPEDSRYTLAQMNAKYSKTIAKIQRPLNRGIDKLVKLLYIKTIGPDPLINNVQVKLNPPTALIIERMSEMFSNIGTIAETAKNLGLPKKYFIKLLLPWLDIDTIDDAELSEKIEEIMNATEESGGGEDEGDLF